MLAEGGWLYIVMKSRGKGLLKTAGGFVGGFLYGYVLGFIGVGLAGAGHGTPLFYDLGYDLYPLGVLHWAVLGALLKNLQNGIIRVLAILLAVWVYGDMTFRVVMDSYDALSFHTMFRRVPEFMAIGIGWFLLGQIVIWTRIAKRSRQEAEE